MRTWRLLLGGLLIWAAHFFGVYIAASLFPGAALARWLTALLTLAALATLAVTACTLLRRRRASGHSDLSLWLDGLAILGIGLAAIAILYQGLPAALSA